ncbi:hypothetical protein [Streptomyces sp900105755]|uniref:RNA polymerase sigma-70 region 2 domain-containing protein n=1 Tax=Streptomyces sp. 900105755 TaxID=3154389 RepID=A0ABV1TIW4_9ACTN
MDAELQESFREFVDSRSSALLRTAVLLTGGDRHAAEDLLRNALIKAAGRWQRIDEPEAYVRQVLYRQQISLWRLRWRRRELGVARPPESPPAPDAAATAELRAATPRLGRQRVPHRLGHRQGRRQRVPQPAGPGHHRQRQDRSPQRLPQGATTAPPAGGHRSSPSGADQPAASSS